MFEITKTKSTAGETRYTVVSGADTYEVKLWIIGNTRTALAFDRSSHNYGSFDPPCTRRFETTRMWRNAVWVTGEGKYVHQSRKGDGELTGCPTIDNALPRRMDDLLEWLEWAVKERVQLIAANAEQDRLNKIGKAAGVSPSSWIKRVPDGPARLLNSVRPYPDTKPYTWRTTGAWLVHSLKGVDSKGAVRLNDAITIGIAALRTYCKAVGHDVIDLTLEPEADALYIETPPDPASPLHAHRSTFKAGAFDQYRGANGFTCAVTFSDESVVALDNRKHRPSKYDHITLEPVTRRKAPATTLDVAVVRNGSQVDLPWAGRDAEAGIQQAANGRRQRRLGRRAC